MYRIVKELEKERIVFYCYEKEADPVIVVKLKEF